MGKVARQPNAPSPTSAGQKFEASFTVSGLDYDDMVQLFSAWVKLVDRPNEWRRSDRAKFNNRHKKGKVIITGGFREIPKRREVAG